MTANGRRGVPRGTRRLASIGAKLALPPALARRLAAFIRRDDRRGVRLRLPANDDAFEARLTGRVAATRSLRNAALALGLLRTLAALCDGARLRDGIRRLGGEHRLRFRVALRPRRRAFSALVGWRRGAPLYVRRERRLIASGAIVRGHVARGLLAGAARLLAAGASCVPFPSAPAATAPAPAATWAALVALRALRRVSGRLGALARFLRLETVRAFVGIGRLRRSLAILAGSVAVGPLAAASATAPAPAAAGRIVGLALLGFSGRVRRLAGLARLARRGRLAHLHLALGLTFEAPFHVDGAPVDAPLRQCRRGAALDREVGAGELV